MRGGTLVRYRYIVMVALALAMAGCGGGDEVPSVADDSARAGRMVLTEADLPGLVRDDDESDEDDEDDPFRQCLNDNQLLADLGEGPRAAEASFADADETLVRASAVTLAESEEDAEEAFAELERPAFIGCFENAIRTSFTEELGDDVDIENLEVADLAADFGDESVGYRATLDLIGEDDQASFAFDYVFIRVDRAVAALFSFDIDDTFDTADRSRLAGILVDRMENEL